MCVPNQGDIPASPSRHPTPRPGMPLPVNNIFVGSRDHWQLCELDQPRQGPSFWRLLQLKASCVGVTVTREGDNDGNCLSSDSIPHSHSLHHSSFLPTSGPTNISFTQCRLRPSVMLPWTNNCSLQAVRIYAAGSPRRRLVCCNAALLSG